MALSKKDNPTSDKASQADADAAVDQLLNEGAGAPATQEAAAEALPEKDEVQKATKDAMLADSAQEEAEAKVRAVEASPNAEETPSGGALKAVAGISDPVEQGEAYAREKAVRRWGYVTPDLQEK